MQVNSLLPEQCFNNCAAIFVGGSRPFIIDEHKIQPGSSFFFQFGFCKNHDVRVDGYHVHEIVVAVKKL